MPPLGERCAQALGIYSIDGVHRTVDEYDRNLVPVAGVQIAVVKNRLLDECHLRMTVENCGDNGARVVTEVTAGLANEGDDCV